MRDAESELFLLAVTNMAGEDTFYERAAKRDARFVELVHTVTATNPGPPVVGGKFKSTRPTSTVTDLFEVTLETWNASWDHTLTGESDPSATLVATYASTVAPR